MCVPALDSHLAAATAVIFSHKAACRLLAIPAPQSPLIDPSRSFLCETKANEAVFTVGPLQTTQLRVSIAIQTLGRSSDLDTVRFTPPLYDTQPPRLAYDLRSYFDTIRG